MSNRIGFVTFVFFFFIILDLIGKTLAGRLPFLAFFVGLGSVVSNVIELACFMVIVDAAFNGPMAEFLKYVAMAFIAMLAAFVLIGGVLI